MDSHGFLQQLDRRLAACFQAQRDGSGVPPAELYRLEGLLEAAIALGLLDAAQAQARVDGQYRSHFGETPVWPAAMPGQPARVRIPLRMPVAPVYPGSRD